MECVSYNKTKKPHALMLPLPSQGHINPLLRLSVQLALRGCTITFVNTEPNHRCMLQSRRVAPPTHNNMKLDIRFATIPDGLPPHLTFRRDMSPNTLRMVLEGMEQHQWVLEQLIEDSKSEALPVSCIISDSLLTWTQDLADRVGIPRASFWTTCATDLYIGYLTASGALDFEATDTTVEPEHLGNGDAQILPFAQKDIPSVYRPVLDLVTRKVIEERFRSSERAACILVNTFEELEQGILEKVKTKALVRPVGPLLPSRYRGGSKEIDEWVGEGLLAEDEGCVGWLEKREVGSVVYISFGSKAVMSGGEFEQLAMGMEASLVPFLWVIREDTKGKNQLPHGFLQRTRGRGTVVPWAPQLRVLAHPAIGAFLTHSGWNSTIESIHMGVPMLCRPVFADQGLNASMVAHQWGVGLSLQGCDANGIAETVRGFIHGERGRDVRNRALEMRGLAQKAVVEKEGSSARSLDDFISQISQ